MSIGNLHHLLIVGSILEVQWERTWSLTTNSQELQPAEDLVLHFDSWAWIYGCCCLLTRFSSQFIEAINGRLKIDYPALSYSLLHSFLILRGHIFLVQQPLDNQFLLNSRLINNSIVFYYYYLSYSSWATCATSKPSAQEKRCSHVRKIKNIGLSLSRVSLMDGNVELKPWSSYPYFQISATTLSTYQIQATLGKLLAPCSTWTPYLISWLY